MQFVDPAGGFEPLGQRIIVVPMAPIVAALDTDSMIALAAYIGSLKP